MRKTFKSWLTGLMVGLIATFQANVFAATSVHFTDMLPNPTLLGASVTSGAPYYNGYDWQVATLAPTVTPGDSLARTPTVVYQSTAIATITGVTTVSTFTSLSQGSVGSTTFPAAWVATGRTIEVVVNGLLTSGATETGTWKLNIGTMTVLNTGAATLNGQQTRSTLTAKATVTIGATGTAGTAFGNYEIYLTSGTNTSGAALVSFSTGTFGAASVDWTTQLAVNPTFAFGTGSSTYTVTNVLVKFLN